MFKLIKSQLEFFASLQTLFPALKIDIFCRIVPYLSLKTHQNSTWNFRTLQTLFSLFENWHFLLHRPPIFH